ncbi:hypothetical protein ACWD5R_12970 [Streptomyces sp. NPDC002514]|uniref:hypothetical protein n=1 Tax=Streptomyces sp. NPDC001270 TaxID=3364554 RepID=UPI0036ABB7AF
MGIESDQVVFEYLSRVGDVAQQQQLPSATRMRLVSGLRNEIDQHRAKVSVDSPAAVRRILDRLGTPDEVVAAAGGDAGVPQPPPAAVPVQPAPRDPEPKGLLGRDKGARERKPRERAPKERGRGLRRVVPRPRSAEPEAPDRPDLPSPPHFPQTGGFGDGALRPDWWRVGDSPFGPGDDVPGFVGGVEIPELLKPPPQEEEPEAEETAEGRAAGKSAGKSVGKTAGKADGKSDGKSEKEARGKVGQRRNSGEAEAEPAAGAAGSSARRRLSLPGPAAGWTNPLLLLAAAALVAGAVLGNWFALILGWIIAYGSRRLTPAESKWAVMVVPGLALAGGLVWLWGRNEGRWGAPIAQGHMSDALGETWPWVVRAAALGSALYVVWRSQRGR